MKAQTAASTLQAALRLNMLAFETTSSHARFSQLASWCRYPRNYTTSAAGTHARNEPLSVTRGKATSTNPSLRLKG